MSESKYYNYKVKHLLSKDIETIRTPDQYINIILCVYLINSNGKLPFLQYLLVNNGSETLTLPKLPVYASLNKESLVPYSEVYLSGILQSTQFEQFSNDISFDGFYEYNDDVYLFFDITKCQINIDETYLSNQAIFGLIDEIVNHKNICNNQIDFNTSFFFIHNILTNYLYDEKNNSYEIPVVGFVGKQTETKLKFAEMFGESAKDKTAILGPYFYFTNYQNSMKQTCDKGGIVRFALFMGHTKHVENAPNDPIDESEIKQHRLQDITLNKQKDVSTLRISDHDGLWANTYDSVYVGNLELDDGSLLDETPMIVVKEYVQQVPLSRHYVKE
jgi:hypothetical protein